MLYRRVLLRSRASVNAKVDIAIRDNSTAALSVDASNHTGNLDRIGEIETQIGADVEE
jgi:hypothetical protein